MEDNNNNPSVDAQSASTEVTRKKLLDESNAMNLQKFFADLIPLPVEKDTQKEMKADELFSQLLASSISQSIENYHKENSQQITNSSNKALQASSLIGRSVLVEDGRFYLEEGATASGRLILSEQAHQVLVYIENEEQQIVRIIPIGDDAFGEITFTWNGITRTGENAAEGEYQFIVSSICNSRVKQQNVFTYNKIIRVTFERISDDMILHFENDFSMKLNDVIEIIK